MDAEECVNDTYLKAWHAIPPTIPRSLRAFLAKIVRNLSIDRYREKRRDSAVVELEAAMAELSACIPTEAEREGAAALSDLLDRFLRAEEETDRRLFLGYKQSKKHTTCSPSPRGKVPTSECGGRRMRVTLHRLFRQTTDQ
jgi:RNA polymerase sigma-70 factor (ECF subfamily)